MCAALLAAAITTGTGAFAQVQQTSEESTLTPKFGIKGGVNLTNMFVEDVSDENMKSCLLPVDSPFNPNCCTQARALSKRITTSLKVKANTGSI
jgi:hypothetical protein